MPDLYEVNFDILAVMSTIEMVNLIKELNA